MQILNGTEKRIPDCPGPLDYRAFLIFDGMLKIHRLRRLRQTQQHIPPKAAILSGTEWGSKNNAQVFKKPFHAAE
jgi:hypothetical protein